MHYYEIEFYQAGDPKHWCFYLRSNVGLTKEAIVKKLREEYLKAGGLEEHHLENLSGIQVITAEEFEIGSRLSILNEMMRVEVENMQQAWDKEAWSVFLSMVHQMKQNNSVDNQAIIMDAFKKRVSNNLLK